MESHHYFDIRKTTFNNDSSQLHKKRLKTFRSSRSGVFLGKGVLKICSKFPGEHQCDLNVLPHGCSSVICCIFSEHLFVRTPLDGCFWTFKMINLNVIKKYTK